MTGPWLIPMTLILALVAGAPASGQTIDDEDEGRKAILAAASSQDWIVRSLGAMRLEARTDVDADTLLDSLRADRDWRVRAMAVRSIARRPGGVERLNGMTDKEPRVIRVALLYGAQPNERVVKKFAERALEDRAFAVQVFGIELAALSKNESLARDAGRMMTRMIQTMTPQQTAYFSSRLARACGLPEGATLRAWRTWLTSTDEPFLSRINPRPSTAAPGASSPPNPPGNDGPRIVPLPERDITKMSDEDFRQFVDYLDGLTVGKIELVLCIDASGSMGPSINAVKEGLDRMVSFLAEVSREVRLGVVTYQNFGDPPVVLPMSNDINRVRSFLWSIVLGGGAEEPVTFAIREAIRQNKWDDEALRMIVLVGDEPYQQRMKPELETMLNSAKSRGFMVHAVYPRAAGFPPWDEVATWGGGKSMSLTETGDLVGLIVSLAVGSIWHDHITDFMRAFAEVAP